MNIASTEDLFVASAVESCLKNGFPSMLTAHSLRSRVQGPEMIRGSNFRIFVGSCVQSLPVT